MNTATQTIISLDGVDYALNNIDMPKFLEQKLKKQYPNNPKAVFGTMNAMGAMKGSKETPKGKMMEKMHKSKVRSAARKAMGGKY